MIYNKILTLGDSQTFGARSYGCYPIYLAEMLDEKTVEFGGNCKYLVINKSVNGYTARDLYFKLCNELHQIEDTYMACLMIGTNDCHKNSDYSLYLSYVNQIVSLLKTKGIKEIYIGLVPPIYNIADPWYPKTVQERRDFINGLITDSFCNEKRVYLVDTSDLDISDYEDSVHFNEKGNEKIAKSFCKAIVNNKSTI
jgi:lysophospholipase L1-like esterase